MPPKPFRIGILGGMGPLAGVEFQKLIIEATPAAKDQDHVAVVCFTDPHIPDRATSLKNDGGMGYVAAIRASAQVLVDAGADVIAIPCNTAYIRFDAIREGFAVPFLDMPALALAHLAARHTDGGPIALLATSATIKSGIYTKTAAGTEIRWMLPEAAEQDAVMRVIARVKAGETAAAEDELLGAADALVARGARSILLGCTELSLYFDRMKKRGYSVVDPMRIAATHLVRLAKSESALHAPHAQEAARA